MCILVVEDLAAAILQETRHDVPSYFTRFADRWAKAARNSSALQNLVTEKTLLDILLADLRDRARKQDVLARINPVRIELNEPVDLLIDAFDVINWALQHARRKPKRPPIWVDVLNQLYIREAVGGRTLVAKHPEYRERSKKFAKNVPTDVGLIVDFTNLMARQLDAGHPDVQTIRYGHGDRRSIWKQAFSRDLARPSEHNKSVNFADSYWAPFWDVHDRESLRLLIDQVRDKTLQIHFKEQCVRLYDRSEHVARGTEASILECLIMVHIRSYDMIPATRLKDA